MIAQQHSAPRQPQVSIPYRMPGEFLYREDFRTQHFVIDSTMPQRLLTTGGMQLSIPACAFMNRDRKRRIFGTVEIVLKELYTLADILLFGRPTSANGNLLEAAAQFQIQAFQSGHPLEVALPIQIRFSSTAFFRKPQRMRLFSGGASAIRSISGQPVFDWHFASSLLFEHSGDTQYQFQVDRCGWWSCQKPYHGKSRRVMMSVRIGEDQGIFRHLDAFLIFRDIPAIVRLYPGMNGFTALNIPEGLQASVFIFGILGEQLYAGQSAPEHTSNRVLNVAVSPSQKEVIRQLIGQATEA
ncbi:MAG: hypothetical protein SH848_14925 [Saprospiraceae bacterium]|nr:hypothetical protein [Saprospiraceae bacterium]